MDIKFENDENVFYTISYELYQFHLNVKYTNLSRNRLKKVPIDQYNNSSIPQE